VRSLLLASSIVLATLATGTAFAQSPAPNTPARSATTPSQASAPQRSPADAAAEQVVNAFMADLASGQLEAARQLMTPEAVVMANGQVLGNRDGYIDGAAKGDADALRVTQRDLLHRDVKTSADVGWVLSEKRLRGAQGPQGPREIVVTETMLLAKTAGGWKITHVHWSSRQPG
jgi:ketosteroid isomerase-like protein